MCAAYVCARPPASVSQSRSSSASCLSYVVDCIITSNGSNHITTADYFVCAASSRRSAGLLYNDSPGKQ